MSHDAILSFQKRFADCVQTSCHAQPTIKGNPPPIRNRHSRFMRVARRVQNRDIARALNCLLSPFWSLLTREAWHSRFDRVARRVQNRGIARALNTGSMDLTFL